MSDTRPVHHLSRSQRIDLTMASRLLTRLTRSHHPCCDCELCEARALTDVQDEAAYHVPYEPGEGEADNEG